MGWIGGYDLRCYCDEQHPSGIGREATFIGRNHTEAIRDARRAGWTFKRGQGNVGIGIARCPGHSKGGRLAWEKRAPGQPVTGKLIWHWPGGSTTEYRIR